jgi:hypothetical protein
MFKRPASRSGQSGSRPKGALSGYDILKRRFLQERREKKREEKKRKKLAKDLGEARQLVAEEQAMRQQAEDALDSERESRQDLVAAAVRQRCAFLHVPVSLGS